MMDLLVYGLAAVGGVWLLRKVYLRLLLSLAKHPSLGGHARMAQRVARLLPFYEFSAADFLAADGAPDEVVQQRRLGFERLAAAAAARAPRTLEASRALEQGVSDVAFTNAYRVPFQFRNQVRARLEVGCVMTATEGRRMRDLDGNWAYDLGGSYGCNLFGYDFYKGCIERGAARVRDLGPVLGPYHPILADNVERLRELSGMDEVSFHMSGTEAVMQAVRLARYHTGRSHVVRFCGAYHGWWDGVQAGVGNPRPPREVYTLQDMDPSTLRVLRKRGDIACVLVNAIQAMNPNGGAPSDSTLLGSGRKVRYDRHAYARWLQQLQEVCTE
ncbi:MAG: aminotransferase class III-fold pyridoxal phosphate-dependent enzyme, partial [Planctomycetes bacterium]|nr:aminotransferase class III-fold pyridoxal phosphate-dependent enzyme [Planctomycetota bacterium]